MVSQIFAMLYDAWKIVRMYSEISKVGKQNKKSIFKVVSFIASNKYSKWVNKLAFTQKQTKNNIDNKHDTEICRKINTKRTKLRDQT